MFSTLLRRSGSVAQLGSPDNAATKETTQYGDVISETVVEPEEIKQSEKNLNDIKQLLSDVVKALKTMTDKGESLSKTQVTWSQAFSKDHEKSVSSSSNSLAIASQYQLQQMENSQNGNGDNSQGFVKAMEQFTISFTKSSNFDLELMTLIAEGFIKPIQQIISNIDERKIHRKKYDKAFGEFETLIGKIKHAQTQKKIDILKLFNYEKEKTKAKLNYEAVKYEYITYLNDVQNRMHSDFIEILVRHYEALSQSFTNSYTEYAGIKSYIDSLRTWCLSEQDFFQKEVIEREQKRIQDLAAEQDAKYQPIIDMMVLQPFTLWYSMADVRKNELYPPPPPPGSNQPPAQPAANPIAFIPHFVRLVDSRGQLSELLAHMVRNDIMNQPTSSLGTVFVNQPIWCELVEEVAMHLAIPYMKYLFDQSITTIIGYPEKFKPNTTAGVEALIGEFNSIIKIMGGSQTYLPPPFKRASLEIVSAVKEKNVASPPSGSLLFARVFAPFVASPHTHGLYNVIPSESALECLQFLSTMLSHAGTNQTFLASQSDYQLLNETLTQSRSKIAEFISSLVSSDLTEWESSVQLVDAYFIDMPTIQVYLKQHYSAIANSMAQKNNDRDGANHFLQSLGHLEVQPIQPEESSSFEKGHAKKASTSNNNNNTAATVTTTTTTNVQTSSSSDDGNHEGNQ